MAAEPRDWLAWIDAMPTTQDGEPVRLVPAADWNAELRDQIAEMAHQKVTAGGQLVIASGLNTLALVASPAGPKLLRHSGAANTDPHYVDGFATDVADGAITAAMWGVGQYRDALGKSLTSDKFAADALKPAAATVGEELIADGAFTADKLDLDALVAELAGRVSDANCNDEMQRLLIGQGGANIFGHGASYDVTLNSDNSLNTDITGITIGLPGTTGSDITLDLNPFTEGEVLQAGRSYSLAPADRPLTLNISGQARGSYIGQRTTPPTVIPGVTREETATEQTFSRTGAVVDTWTAPVTTTTSSGSDITLIDRSGSISSTWTAPVTTTTAANEDVTLIDRSGSVVSTWAAETSEEVSTGTDVTLIDRSGSIASTWTPPVTHSAASDVTLINRTGTATATYTAPVTRRVSRRSRVFNRSGTATARWTAEVRTPGTGSTTTRAWSRSGSARYWYSQVGNGSGPRRRLVPVGATGDAIRGLWTDRRIILDLLHVPSQVRVSPQDPGQAAYDAARSASITEAARLRGLGIYQRVEVNDVPPPVPTESLSRVHWGRTSRLVQWSITITTTTRGTSAVTTPGSWAWDATSYAAYTRAVRDQSAAQQTGDTTSNVAPALPPPRTGALARVATTQSVAWRVQTYRTTTTTTTTPGSWSVNTATYDAALTAYNAVSVSGYTNVRRTVTAPTAPTDSPSSATTRTLNWHLRIIATTTTSTTTPGSWSHGSRAAYTSALAAYNAVSVTGYTNVRRTATAPVLPSADPQNPGTAQTSTTTWRLRIIATSTTTTTTTTPGSWTHGSQSDYTAAVAAAAALDVSDYSNVRRTTVAPTLPVAAPTNPRTAQTSTATWRVRVVATSTTTTTTTEPGFWTHGATTAYDAAVTAANAIDTAGYTNVRRTDTAPVLPSDSPAAAVTRSTNWRVMLVVTSTTEVTTTTPGYWTRGDGSAFVAAVTLANSGAFEGVVAISPPGQGSGDGGATNTTRSFTWTVTVTRTFTRVVTVVGGRVVAGTVQNVTLDRLYTITMAITFSAAGAITATIHRQAIPATIDATLNPTNVVTTHAFPLSGIVVPGEFDLEYGQMYGEDGEVYELWPTLTGPSPRAVDIRKVS